MQEPTNGPWTVCEWAAIVPPDMPPSDIFAVQQYNIREWLRWGAEHGAAANAEQRQKMVDAIVLTETRYAGTETAPDLPGDERILRLAKARRASLELLSSGAEMAEQCRLVRDEEIERQDNSTTFLVDARKQASDKARRLVSSRYWYAPALVELARHYRGKGKGWTAQRAIQVLESKPFHCADGAVVSVKGGRVVMKHPDHDPADIAAEQFQKQYWRRAK